MVTPVKAVVARWEVPASHPVSRWEPLPEVLLLKTVHRDPTALRPRKVPSTSTFYSEISLVRI